ncbi:hypothetical protein KM043_008991 [Ampulex compressa]|nr:hypothetical protein KM043_008991 [Ampulex compressa]
MTPSSLASPQSPALEPSNLQKFFLQGGRILRAAAKRRQRFALGEVARQSQVAVPLYPGGRSVGQGGGLMREVSSFGRRPERSTGGLRSSLRGPRMAEEGGLGGRRRGGEGSLRRRAVGIVGAWLGPLSRSAKPFDDLELARRPRKRDGEKQMPAQFFPVGRLLAWRH